MIGENKYGQNTNPQFKITYWLFYHQLVIYIFSFLVMKQLIGDSKFGIGVLPTLIFPNPLP